MARLFRSLIVSVVLLPFVEDVATAQPTLTINGVTATDNSGVPHTKKFTPFELELTGTPGAPFALILAADAFDGSTMGEPTINQGFFLHPWRVAPVIDVPLHPIFDGIGMEYIRTKLGAQGDALLAPTDIVADTASPLFRFNAAGEFKVTFNTPSIAALKNNTPTMSFPDPLVIPLESPPSGEISLFMQIVELDVQTLDIVSGNGVKVVFDNLKFGATIGYSEGEDANQTTNTVSARQTLGTLFDGNFADGTTFGINVASDFGGTFVSNVDIWRIALSGTHEGWEQSLSPVGENGTVSAPDNDNQAGLVAAQAHASGLEFLAGGRPQLNNENFDFPSISLPGGRELFHWRNASLSPTGPTYGFGIYFRDSNTFRNLVPATFSAFVGSATLSPWELEVGVTPDGNRALVILDPSSGANDRAFVLNLEEGVSFSNGFPIVEVTPTNATDLAIFRRVWAESIDFLSDGSGGWVAFLCSSDDTSNSLSAYPKGMFRIGVSQAPPFPGANTFKVIPNAPLVSVTRVDRQPVVSPDRKSLVVTYGAAAANENIASVTAVTAGAHTLKNITAFPVNTTLLETNDSSNGFGGTVRFSVDGSTIAFVRIETSVQTPLLAKVDGSQAGMLGSLVTDQAVGGLFDTTYFRITRDVFITDDNSHLMFFQGLRSSGAPTDRHDFFTLNLTNSTVTNLTRTLATQSVNGPFTAKDPSVTTPNIDPSGIMVSPNRRYLYFFRDGRGGTVPFDRFNVVAVSIAPDGPSGLPTFEMVNVTGTEFAPFPGDPLPSFGAADVTGDGSFGVEGTPHYLQMRRVGGNGPFSNYAFFTARYADTGPSGAFPNKQAIDQILLFDLNNPAPAFFLTDFATDSTPIAVSLLSKITNVVPSQDATMIAFTMDADGPNIAQDQDLFLLDLAAFGAVRRIPDNAPPFSRLITAGSTRFVGTNPPALVFASGSVARSGGTTDGAVISSDATNPIDATPFFHRFDQKGTVYPLTGAPAGSNRRAVFIWGAKGQ